MFEVRGALYEKSNKQEQQQKRGTRNHMRACACTTLPDKNSIIISRSSSNHYKKIMDDFDIDQTMTNKQRKETINLKRGKNKMLKKVKYSPVLFHC